MFQARAQLAWLGASSHRALRGASDGGVLGHASFVGWIRRFLCDRPQTSSTMQDYRETIPGINDRSDGKSKVGVVATLILGAVIIATGGAFVALRYFGETDVARTIAVGATSAPAASTSGTSENSPPHTHSVRNDPISDAFKTTAPSVLSDMKAVRTSLAMGSDSIFVQNVISLQQSYNQLAQIWTDDYLKHNREYGMSQKKVVDAYVDGMALIARTIACDFTDPKPVVEQMIYFNADILGDDQRTKLRAAELEALQLAPAYWQKAFIKVIYPYCKADEAQTALVEVLDGSGRN